MSFPPEMWQAKQNSNTRIKQGTTTGKREGQETRSTAKTSSGQPQQFVVGVAYVVGRSSTYYVVGLVPCYPVCHKIQ